MTIAKATAPLAAAWLHTTTHGYAGVFVATAPACLIAATALIAVPAVGTPQAADNGAPPVSSSHGDHHQ